MGELQTFLDRTVSILSKDQRFLAIAVAGSWITGTTDESSDLDLVLYCRSCAEITNEREKIAATLGDLLSAFTGEHVGESRLLICFYGNPTLHVDLKFVEIESVDTRIENAVVVWEREQILTKRMAKSEPVHPMPNTQWIEDRFWIWVHYAAMKLGRGELFEVIDLLSFVRASVLGPLSLVKHGQLPRGVRRLETLALEDLADFRATVATYDRDSCARAIQASISLYRKLREEGEPLTRRDRAERAAVDSLATVISHHPPETPPK